MRFRRFLSLIVAALLPVLTLVATTRPSTAQTPTDLVEVSQSCVAFGQHFPTFTVWGTGFDQWVANGGFLSVEWSWGGAPSTTDPATVTPPSQDTRSGSFTMTFDVTGGPSPGGSGVFEVVYNNGVSPTLVGTANVNINATCPTESATCSTTPGTATLLVSTNGYDPTFAVQFFYQYHLPDQAGPVNGTAAPDGSVHGQFQPAPQSTNATVTARIVQPPQGDFSGQTYFITVGAPVCHDVPFPTTTTSLLSPTTTNPVTVTTRPPTSTSRPGATTTSSTFSSSAASTTPVLAVSPSVGSGGTVVTVTGSGFPPNTAVTVAWQPGIGQATAQTDALGVFSVALLVFTHDIVGPRHLISPAFPGATVGFLDEPGTFGPPGDATGQWVFRH